MDFFLGLQTEGLRRRGSALIVLAIIAALGMTIASPAQATPNTAKAWGANFSGQLGDGTRTGPEKCGPPSMEKPCSTTPVAVSGLSGVAAVAAGPAVLSDFTLALLEGGRVTAWGEGGKLGDGTATTSDVPVGVCAVGTVGECPSGPFLQGATAISAGEEHALALLPNGTVVAWGYNLVGELGNGTHEPSKVPEPVCAMGATAPCSEESKQLKEVVAIATGGEHSLALLSNHTVVAWGQNVAGELGNNGTGESTVPVAVCAPAPEPCPGSHLSEVAAIAAGDRHSLALLKDGTVMTWGLGSVGELGNGKNENSKVPVAVSGLSGVSAIAGGGRHSLALLKDGTVKAWGENRSGQLGEGSSAGPEACGTTACSKIPVEVCSGSHPGPACGVLSGVSAIAAGGEHSLALLTDGTVKAWGANGSGQLGDGTSSGPELCGREVCSTIPVEVTKVSGTKGIAGGGLFSLAFGASPAVTGVRPKKGPVGGGTTVNITGTDFIGATEVKFGSSAATSFTVNSATSITAVTPAELEGRVDVRVVNDWGTSAKTRADRFSFTPTVTGVSPNSGPSAGGISVTVTGTGFLEGTTGTKFKFGGVRAPSVNCTSTTSCTVETPPHAVGTVNVRAIVNRVSSPRNRPGDEFTYN